MTPDAEDLCVFAMKRGNLIGSEIYCNKIYPFYLFKMEQYMESSLCKGKLEDFVSVNPRTNYATLNDNDIVAFVPMTVVGEKNNHVIYEQRKFEEVKKGFTIFQRGDLLWAKITPCMQNGKSCVVDALPTDVGFGSTEFHVLRPKTDKIYMPFLWAIFSNDDILKAAQGVFGGSAGQQRVPASFLEKFPAVFPEYDVQVKMVKHLEEKLLALNSKIKEADILLVGMNAFIESIFDVNIDHVDTPMFFGLRNNELPKRIDVAYNNPKYKEIQRLMQIKYKFTEFQKIIHSISGGATPLRKNHEQYSDSGVNFLRIQNITSHGVNLTDVKHITNDVHNNLLSRSKLSCGDLLLTITGRIGTCSIVEEKDLPANINQHIARIKLKGDVDAEFLSIYLNSRLGLLYSNRGVTGTTRTALDYKSIRNIPIPEVSPEKRKAIKDEYKRRFTLATQLKKEAEQEWRAAKEQFEKELLGDAE